MRIIVAAAVLASSLGTGSAGAQDAAGERARAQEKAARAAAVARAPVARQLLPPGASTSRREYFRVEIHQGGVYEPSLYPTESWLQIACIHDDLQTEFDSRFGFSLVEIHALVYDADFDVIHDTTGASTDGGAICDLHFTVDHSFVKLPRRVGRRAAGVGLFVSPMARQYVEASKLVYRILPE